MIRTRFCPVCAKKVEIKEKQHHVGRRNQYAKNSTLLKLPEEDKDHMMFKSHKKTKLKRPYTVYADTKCSMVPTGLTDTTHNHVPNSACVYFVCDYDPTQNRLWYDIGPTCIVNMLVELTKLSDERITKRKKNQEM